MRVRGAIAVLCVLAAGCGSAHQQPIHRTAQRERPKPEKHVEPLAAIDADKASGTVNFCSWDTTGIERDDVKDFNAADYGVHVRYVALPQQGNVLRARLMKKLQNGDCDLLYVDDEALIELAAAGALTDLTRYVDARRREFFPALLSAVRYQGKDWGVPRRFDVRLLYYHDSTDAPPRTWQVLYGAAGRDGLTFGGDEYLGAGTAFLELAYAAGGRVLSPDGTRSVLDSPVNQRALELLRRAINGGHVSWKVADRDDYDAALRFTRGEGRFMLNWSTLGRSLSNSDQRKSDVRAAPVPPLESGGRATIVTSTDLVVPRAAVNVAGAMKVIDVLTGPAAEYNDAFSAGAASPLVATYNDPALRQKDSALAFADAIKRSMEFAHPLPASPANVSLTHLISIQVQAMLDGRLSSAAALKAASEDIDAALAAHVAGDFS